MKKLIGFALVLFISAFTAIAQPSDTPFKEMREEIKAYTEQNVLPVLKEQRQELENQLSEADKASISTLREQLKKHREEGKAFREATKEAWENGTLTDQQKIKMVDLQLERKAIMKEVREIAEANETLLKDLHESITPQQMEWKEDLKQIHEKYREELEEFRENRKANREEKPRKGKKGRHGHRGGSHKGGLHKGDGLGKLLTPERFLLWDFENSSMFDTENQEFNDEIMAYPNPTSGQSTIEFAVPSSGQVTVTLIDRQGNEVRKLFEGQKEEGTHTLNLNTEGLENGVYFYKVSTSTGSNTKRIVIRK